MAQCTLWVLRSIVFLVNLQRLLVEVFGFDILLLLIVDFAQIVLQHRYFFGR